MIKRFILFCNWTLFATCFIFLLLELASRSFITEQSISMSEREAYANYEWTEQYFKDYTSYNAGSIKRKQYVPFSLWREDPFSSETFTIEKNGLRRTTKPISAPKHKSKKIFLFGGSTMFGAQVPDNKTIPSILAKILDRKIDTIDFQITNYGMDGYLSDQERVLLSELLVAGERPNIAIFYDGANDIFHKSIANIPHSFYSRFLGALDRKQAFKETFFSLSRRSHLLKLLTGPQKVQYPTDRAIIEQRVIKAVARYKANIQFISKTIAPSYDFTPLFLWQPTLLTTKKKLSAEEEKILHSLDPSLRIAFDAAQQQITQAQDELPEGFHNCASCFDSVSRAIFLDFCHVTAAGNEAIANEMASLIVARLGEL